MSHTCSEVEALIDRRRGGLRESERLVIETHVAGCAACARTLAHMAAVGALMDGAPEALSSARRERAIAGAFAAAAQQPHAVRSRVGMWVLSGLVVAAAAAFVVLSRDLLRPAPESVAERTQIAAHEAPAAAAPPVEAPDDILVSPDADRHFAFLHAEVRVEKGATVRFIAADHALELLNGAVDVEVDPRPRAPFRVRTPHFWVDVLGTGFHVSSEGVEVRHGLVRVLATDGRELAAGLRAGEAFHYVEPAQQAASPALAEAKGSAVRIAPQRLLAEARAALARGDVGAAEQALNVAARAAHRKRDRAEVDTVGAECALVAGALADAQARYLAVSEAYVGLPAAENALFSAAKLARRRAQPDVTRALLTRYVARYPAGQFVREARALLAQ
jgi:hypothetical protein